MHGPELTAEFLSAVPEMLTLPDGSVFVKPDLPTYEELESVWLAGKLTTWDSGGMFGVAEEGHLQTETMVTTSVAETAGAVDSEVSTTMAATTELSSLATTEGGDTAPVGRYIAKPSVGIMEDVLCRPI